MAVAQAKVGRPVSPETIEKAEKAKELRKEGLSYSQVAEELGVSKKYAERLDKSCTKLSNIDSSVHDQGQRAKANHVSRYTQNKLDKLATLDRQDLLQEVQSNTKSIDAAYREATGKPKPITLPRDILKASDRLIYF